MFIRLPLFEIKGLRSLEERHDTVPDDFARLGVPRRNYRLVTIPGNVVFDVGRDPRPWAPLALLARKLRFCVYGGSFAARWARMVLKRCSSERGERV